MVFGARDEGEVGALREAIEDTLAGVRSLPQVLWDGARARDLGPHSPWGRFRVAVDRFDALLYELVARRRAESGRGLGARALLASAMSRQPAERSAAP